MRVLFALFALPTFLLAAAPADACSIWVPDERFQQTDAPAGGAFFVHATLSGESGIRSTTEDIERDAFLEADDGTVYPVEIVSRTDRSIAIRAPAEAPVGTVLQLQALVPEWSWDQEPPSGLRIVAGDAADLDAPILDELTVRTLSEEQRRLAVPLIPESNSCGGGAGGVWRTDLRFSTRFEIPKDLLDGDASGEDVPLVLDAWVAAPGELDPSTLVGDAIATLDGYFLPEDGGGLYNFVKDGGDVLYLELFHDDANPVQEVHLRVRDPRTGLASPIVSRTISTPDTVEGVAHGCSSTVLDVEQAGPAFAALLLALPLLLRRRRR